MNRTIYVLPMLALLAAAANPVPQNWKQQAIRAAAPSIDRANDEWTRAIVSGDADALSAPYANDGIFIGPDGSEVRGRNAVRVMYAKPRSAKVLKASIKSEGRAAADPRCLRMGQRHHDHRARRQDAPSVGALSNGLAPPGFEVGDHPQYRLLSRALINHDGGLQ